MKKIILTLVMTGLLCRVSAETLEYPENMPAGSFLNTTTGNVEVEDRMLIFKDYPVQPRHRYLVTIRARIKKGAALEDTPAMKIALEQSIWSRNMPWELPVITFEYRSENKRLWARYHGAAVPVFSKEFRDYKIDFYAFDNADTVRFFIRPQAPGNTVEIASAEIVELYTEKEPYLNANPDLSFGMYNPSGWGHAEKATFGRDDSGPYIDVGTSWAVGDAIPVTPGERLNISYKGTPAQDRSSMNFGTAFFKTPQFTINGSDRVGANKLPMRATAKVPAGSSKIVVPEGANWMRLCFNDGCMRYIKVEKITEGRKTE